MRSMNESGEHGASEHGVHLRRTAENAAEIDALAAVLGDGSVSRGCCPTSTGGRGGRGPRVAPYDGL